MSTFYLDYENGSDSNNGSTWELAWKTITSGATAARIAPGDTIRIAKSPDPTSIGNGTWTDLSKDVVLATAQTLNIDDCETAWTADNSSTVATNTDRKLGSYSLRVTPPAVPGTFTVYAHLTLTETDFSSYDGITLWVKNEVAIADANWRIVLCSDTDGLTVVNRFPIPAIPSTGRWVPLMIPESQGNALGSSIKSIALTTVGTAPTGSKYIMIDNIHAVTDGGLSLQSLISKNSAAQGGTEGWYGLQSISADGLTLKLDNDTNTQATAGRGYSGTTETVTTYKRETIKLAIQASTTTSVHTIQENGNTTSYNTYSGGWDTSSNTQNGETFWDGLNGYGVGIYQNSKSYIAYEHINYCRFATGLDINGGAYNNVIDIGGNNNFYNVLYLRGGTNNNTIGTITNMNNGYGNQLFMYTTYNNTIGTIVNANNNISTSNGAVYFNVSHSNTINAITNINNNAGYGMYISVADNNSIGVITNCNRNSYGIYLDRAFGTVIRGVTNASYNANAVSFIATALCIIQSLSTSNSTTNAIYASYGNGNYIRNATIAEATEVGYGGSYAPQRIYSWRHDNTDNNHWIFERYCNANSQATTRHTASGLAWTIRPTNAERNSANPFKFKVADVLCKTASQAVTVTCYVKKEHATNIAAKLICPGGQLAGVTSDVEDTKASDTDWEQLSVNFTPTEVGVIEVYVYVWYVAAAGDVYVDDIGVTYG